MGKEIYNSPLEALKDYLVMNTKVVSGGVVFLHVHFFYSICPELKQNSLTFP